MGDFSIFFEDVILTKPGKETRSIPNYLEALTLLYILRVPWNVIRHAIIVASFTKRIVESLKNDNAIDENLVFAGALLHDVGRIKSHGANHGVIGRKILLNLGFPDSLARICETHTIFSIEDEETSNTLGIPVGNYLPKTLEEKIIAYADKRIHRGKILSSVEERYNYWFKRFGQQKVLIKGLKICKEIEKELAALTGQRKGFFIGKEGWA